MPCACRRLRQDSLPRTGPRRGPAILRWRRSGVNPEAHGLAAIVASSSAAFSVVKYAGAAYLVWLGIKALRSKDAVEAEPNLPRRRLFWSGFLVGALNPKLALFLLAFLPQFVDPAAGPIWTQTLALGVVFTVCAAIGDTVFALLAGSAGSQLRRAIRGRRIARASGVVYLGLGVSAAVADGRAHRA